MSLLPPRPSRPRKKRICLDHVEDVLTKLIEKNEPISNPVLKQELLQIVRDYKGVLPTIPGSKVEK